MPAEPRVAIIGGTGALGFGLALRLASAGVPITIGSRDADRAVEAAERVRSRVADADVAGADNAEAAQAAETVILTVPFRNQSETLTNLKPALRPGQLVVDTTVPLAAAVSGKATRTLGVWQGSAAQQTLEMVPDGVRVVSALHTVGAGALADLDEPLAEDCLVCGDARDDKRAVAALLERIPGLRCVDCGRLEQARLTEQLTALLIAVNVRYKTHAGIRITGLPAELLGLIVVLAGGTGGAKLARGMLDVVGDRLVVIANTGDDIEIHGAHVSPDPDLVSYWLADRIDDRGWGLRDDTFAVMDGLTELGDDVWFRLGDRDLAICLRRARRLAEGASLTECLAELCAALGIAARVLPMSDDPVRTRIRADGRWRSLQEFLILDGGAGTIEEVVFDGADRAVPAPAALDAIAAATAIVIGPSNPAISIAPILAIPGLREALRAASAPVVAVSPIVGGEVVKGPTAAFMAWAGRPLSAIGIAELYADVADGLLADEPAPGAGLEVDVVDTLMADGAGRRRVAEAALALAARLARPAK